MFPMNTMDPLISTHLPDGVTPRSMSTTVCSCDDGSQSAALWLWHGTNIAGNPFELAGISLATHDEDGLISYELVTYPYPDDYVREAVMGSGN